MSGDESLRALFAKRAKRTPPPPPFEAVHAAFGAADRRDSGRWLHALVAFAVAASTVLAVRGGWLRPDATRTNAVAPSTTERVDFAPARPDLGSGVCREGAEPLVCRDEAVAPTRSIAPARVVEAGGYSRAPATMLSCVPE